MFLRKEIPFREIEDQIINNQRVYKTPVGDFPSVTTILSVKDTGFLDEWRAVVGDEYANWVTSEAGRRGSDFHNTVELYLKNQAIDLSRPDLKAHFNQVKRIFDDQFELIYANEIPLYSQKLRVAGRCDCVAKVKGKNRIVDFKTSRRLKHESEIGGYFLQCSAYSFMLKEMYGIDVPDFMIIISNLEVSFPSIFYGHRDDYIKDYALLRVKFKKKFGF